MQGGWRVCPKSEGHNYLAPPVKTQIDQAGKMVKGDRKSHLTVKLASVYGNSETAGWVGVGELHTESTSLQDCG